MADPLTIKVTPEGRDGVWVVADRDSLKAWIATKQLDRIHNFTPAAGMMLGADHDLDSVLKDIDAAARVAVLTGDPWRGNMKHALSIVMPAVGERDERLEVFDIGELTDADLEVADEWPATKVGEGVELPTREDAPKGLFHDAEAAPHPHGSVIEQVHRIFTSDQGVDSWVLAEEIVTFVRERAARELDALATESRATAEHWEAIPPSSLDYVDAQRRLGNIQRFVAIVERCAGVVRGAS